MASRSGILGAMRRHRNRLIIVLLFIAIGIAILSDQVAKPCSSTCGDESCCRPLNNTSESDCCITSSNTAASNTTAYALTESSKVECCYECGRKSCLNLGFNELIKWVEMNVALGCFILALAYAVCVVLLVPAAVLTLGAGAAFGSAIGMGKGTLVGSISVVAGASGGALFAFLLGHYVLHNFLQKLLHKWSITKAIDEAFRKEGLKVMVLLRLSPLIPFSITNYILAGTSITLRDYSLALCAIVPGTVGYVYIGASAAVAASGDSSNQAITLTFLILGIAAAFAAVLLVSWYAKKALVRFGIEQSSPAGLELDNEANPTVVTVQPTCS